MNQRVQIIANQMLKGPVPGRYAKGTTEDQRRAFLEQNRPLIEEYLRRGPRASAAVGAVICKCALFYGKEKAFKLADALRGNTFEGANDPAHHLWLKLNKRNVSTIDLYKFSVTAARAFCEGRTITQLRQSTTDVFDSVVPK